MAMDRDKPWQEAKESDTAKPSRNWTQRSKGQFIYRRFTANDSIGRPSILFKFELAAGQTELPQAVYEILQSVKYLDRNPAHGFGTGLCPTGLSFMRHKTHGRVWRLPDNGVGRTAADIIDARLTDLAEKLHNEKGQGR